MNKIIGFGVAVVLCMAAAGMGAYLALRQEPVAALAPLNGPAAGPAAQITTDTAVAAKTQGVAVPAGAQVPPLSSTRTVQASRESQVVKPANPAASTASAPAGTDRTVSGGTAAVPPASELPVTAAPASAAGAPAVEPPPPPPATEPIAAQPPIAPQKAMEELVVTADSVIGLRIENTINSEVARVEDPVEARVSRDVRVGSEIAIPAGSRVLGSVIQVERGGKMKTAARIGVRFHTLVLADGTRTPMQTEAIYREGSSPGKESAAKVGGATAAGAILGAIIGGGKGAAIGGAVGAAGGTGVVMAGGRNPAVLASGTALTVHLSHPVTVVVERDEFRD